MCGNEGLKRYWLPDDYRFDAHEDHLGFDDEYETLDEG